MMQQSLFSPTAYGDAIPAPPMSANGDPITSYKAEERHQRSAKGRRRRDLAVALVKANPDRTGHELWRLATDADRTELGDYHELYRRLSEARHAGLIEQGPSRVCTVKAVRMVT